MQRVTFPIVVHTLVFDDAGRLLLLKRARTGFMDGRFGLPGGHLHADEKVAHAAIRECLEEACITVSAIDPVVVMPFDGGVDFIFEARTWSGDARVGEPDRCDGLDWFPVDRLPFNVVPFVRKALELRNSRIWYHQFEG